MKTIATAAALIVMTATAWADEPIELSDAELDGVTAGSGYVNVHSDLNVAGEVRGTSSTSTVNDGLTLSDVWGYNAVRIQPMKKLKDMI